MSLVTDPSVIPKPHAFLPSLSHPQPHPHRRLYHHHNNNRPHYRHHHNNNHADSVSFFDQPLMLLPRAKVYDDNDDLLRHRNSAVIADNDGLEKIYISAISAASGWLGRVGGDGGGRGMLGGERGRRPLTAFDYNAQRKRKEIKDAREEELKDLEEEEAEDTLGTPTTSTHPLMTRRGKMALLRHRSSRQNHNHSHSHSHRHGRSNASERSASADSGLGLSGSRSNLDKMVHDRDRDRDRDVSASSDVFDDVVTRYSSNESLSLHKPRAGLFGGYMEKNALAHPDTDRRHYEFAAGKVFRGAQDTSDDDDDDDDDEVDANSSLMTSKQNANDVKDSPDHLDNFGDNAGQAALVRQLRKEKKRSRTASGSVEDSDDVFDDKWHAGHASCDNCPLCLQFARATRKRVDRFFGGTESFLGWIFSKWGKRKDVEGAYRRKIGIRGRSQHFCNFVQKADIHSRPDAAHGRGSVGSDDDDGIGSMTTDQDFLAQWRNQSRMTGSGTEGRPGSPTSLDGRHKDDADDANNSSDAMSVSVLVNHLVNSEGDSLLRGESDTRSTPRRTSNTVATMTDKPLRSKPPPRVVKRPPSAPRARPIPTITIPSSPLPPDDQSLTNRTSSGADQSSPRKSVREEPPASNRSVERPASASRGPPPLPKEKEIPDKAKRPPVVKKTRKASGGKRRKSKSSAMEPANASAAGGVPQQNGDGSEGAAAAAAEAKGKVPELPASPQSGKGHGRHSKRGSRRMISTPPDGGDKLRTTGELFDLDSNNSRTGYDFGDMETPNVDANANKFRIKSWLNSRMALSQKASRFELPMDMKLLETITTKEYLKRFCVVSSRRLNLYQKIFVKHKDKTHHINKQMLETCLKETLVKTLKENTFSDLCDLLDIEPTELVDFKLFAGLSALTERILYPHYTFNFKCQPGPSAALENIRGNWLFHPGPSAALETSRGTWLGTGAEQANLDALTDDTIDRPEYQREAIETADFEALSWKLKGINVTDKMLKLLQMIQ